MEPRHTVIGNTSTKHVELRVPLAAEFSRHGVSKFSDAAGRLFEQMHETRLRNVRLTGCVDVHTMNSP